MLVVVLLLLSPSFLSDVSTWWGCWCWWLLPAVVGVPVDEAALVEVVVVVVKVVEDEAEVVVTDVDVVVVLTLLALAVLEVVVVVLLLVAVVLGVVGVLGPSTTPFRPVVVETCRLALMRRWKISLAFL